MDGGMVAVLGGAGVNVSAGSGPGSVRTTGGIVAHGPPVSWAELVSQVVIGLNAGQAEGGHGHHGDLRFRCPSSDGASQQVWIRPQRGVSRALLPFSRATVAEAARWPASRLAGTGPASELLRLAALLLAAPCCPCHTVETSASRLEPADGWHGSRTAADGREGVAEVPPAAQRVALLSPRRLRAGEGMRSSWRCSAGFRRRSADGEGWSSG